MLPWNAEDLTFDESRFTGKVRLFPLPDLVMYPHVMQPLHIFESRYREMLNEALDGDGLLTMSLLDEGWEGEYEGRPRLFPYACLGKVVTHHRLDDGTYNLLLLGVRRVRLIEELSPERAFREARVELLEDVYQKSGEPGRAERQELLTAAFQRMLPPGAAPNESIRELLAAKAPLGVLTDLVSFALPLEPALKRELLAECDVDRRAERLLAAIRDAAPLGDDSPGDQPDEGRLPDPPRPRFPFSLN